MKRTLCSALACLMLLPTSALAVQATPNHQPIVRNGQEVSLAGYEIDGYTIFKLATLPAISEWHRKSVFGSTTMAPVFLLTTGQPYHPCAGRSGTHPGRHGRRETALISRAADRGTAQSVTLTACEVDGFNYLKPRDSGEALNFPVDYEEATHTILLGTHATQAQAVLEIVNEKRRRRAMPANALTLDPEPCQVNPPFVPKNWAPTPHDRPDGTLCFTVFDEVGIKNLTTPAGENIAMGDSTDAVMVMEGWMNSPGHRAQTS